jgi:TniB protein
MSIDLSKLAAHRRAAMDAIFIEHPRVRDAHSKFEFLIEHGLKKKAGGKLCLALIADSQSGKSALLEHFANSKNTAEALAEHHIPVLHVTLEANTTRKGLAHNILEAIEELGFEVGSHSGSETILLRRVRIALNNARVQLLILDEFHHLVNSDNTNVAFSVSETIKRMLIKGVCPIVMSGIKEAERALKNRQLMQRALPPIVLDPLTANNPADLKLFIEFLARYARSIEQAGIAKNATAIVREDMPACLLEVSQGVLGTACNIVKQSVTTMTYAGRNSLERSDFAEATNSSFVQTGLYSRNPFIHGFSSVRAAA